VNLTSLVASIERRLRASDRAAFAALWLVLVAQVIWTAYFFMRAHPALADIYYPVLFMPAAAVLAVTRGRSRWWATIARLLIAVAFVENVADRLGFFGPPGAPGVSWGDFQHFIAYTAEVNAFAPKAIIPALAVVATIAEGTCGLLMLLGIRLRLAAAGSALLLFVFATSMVLSGLSQFQYNVSLMSVAAWALATIDGTALSVDGLVERHRRRGNLPHRVPDRVVAESAPD
jgi:uncharacterized membrane protein YphA (DoxX/SURF4 family)